MTDLPAFVQLDDDHKREFWRYEYLTTWCALDHRDATELAQWGVDPHQVEDLLARGCEVRLIKRILHPT